MQPSKLMTSLNEMDETMTALEMNDALKEKQ